jgi:formamidopyrimidine-DNA glycosylase
VPELPEVETVRTALAPVLEGRRIAAAEILDERLTRPEPAAAVAAELEDEEVAAVRRRGKYLLLELASGRTLAVHLRMTGSFRTAPPEALEPDPHRRALLVLDDGTLVAYRDVRRFGTWNLLGPAERGAYLAERLGPEPLDGEFTAATLAALLASRRAPVKAVLLDQRSVAGIGNIYADEALWRARIHPATPARELEPTEVRALHRSVRSALRAGIARQGATLRDYRAPSGEAGSMQDEFRVYGRAGLPCPRCGFAVERTVLGGRGTWYCPRCQRRGL